jgi:lysophospholipase L1-like esterase
MITSGGVTLDRGFAYNWSRSGATTSILMAGGQHTRLAAQVRGGAALDLAAVTIGSNDFADALITSRTAADMGPTLERANSNIAAILDTLLGIDPEFKVAVFTAVDLRPSPILRGALEFGLISPMMSDAYAATIAEFNDGLRGLIAGHGHRAVIVDVNQLLIDVIGARRYAIGSLELDRSDASNDPRHLFLSDGFHPGTIGQCLIANRFLVAINERFGADVELLGEEEMIRVATSVPKPSGLSLLGTGVLAQFGYRRRPAREA